MTAKKSAPKNLADVVPPSPSSSHADGFDAGEAWIPPLPGAPGAGAGDPLLDDDAAGLFGGLFKDGEKVTADKAAAWLQQITGGLDERYGNRAKADLRMTDVEARYIGEALATYSERTGMVALAIDPPPLVKIGIGTTMYGLRVHGERRFALELEADAAQGAANLTSMDEPAA